MSSNEMRINISRILSRHCLKCANRSVPIVLLLIILCGQSHAQWQRTNMPENVRVNTVEIRDSIIVAGTYGSGIFVSTDEGENWTSSNKGQQDTIIHTVMILGNSIFAGTETGVSVSTDNGENWRSINSGLSGLGVWSLEVSAGTAGDTTIFAGTWSGVYSSTDRGEHWKVTGLSSTTMPVHSIVIFDRYIYAATFSEGIFLSRDNGLTWWNFDIKTDNPIPVSVPICSIGILVVPFSNYIIAGSSFGDFYSMYYGGTNFLEANGRRKQGLPIICFANRNDTLFAADSYGNFFDCYVSDFELTCDLSIIPYLGDRTVYSLALNNAYIFTGTEDGIWRLSYPGAITSVEHFQDIPSGFVLEQNYPNPFNPTTTIRYQIPEASRVIIRIYNLLGQNIATLVNEQRRAGSYSVEWNASDVPSGVYFYRTEAVSVSDPDKRFVDVKKMILLK
jgi:hypothetical protein